MTTPAVFLDRDGTIIDDVGYLDDPAGLRLLPGSAGAIARFREAGYLVVLISNQSGVARGMFDEETLGRVHARLQDVLGEHGAKLDGAYYCPYLDGAGAKVDAFRRDSELRKPKPGMLLQAARELKIDLKQSWMIGDALSDVEAGRRAGCRTIRVCANGAANEGDAAPDVPSVPALSEAADLILNDKASSTEHPREANSSQADSSSNEGETVRILRRIHDQLDRLQREQRQHDFSLLRLFATLLQMFAIVGGLWGAVALLNDDSVTATGRLTLACFLQIASLTVFALDRWR